jgi:hypothetical protein
MARRKQRLVALICKAQAYFKTKTVTPLSRVGIIGVFALIGVLAIAGPVLAQTPPTQSVSAGDMLMLFIAQISMSIAMFLMQMTIAFLGLVMKLMLYNGFSTSPVVAAGWSVVRDSVNMFYVIILIGIAVGTIFGTSRFKWNQVLPRLLIFAIVINFSKTLCALMIDFGQVIMLTFANAVRQVAAGNFIQTLGLDKIITLSREQINVSVDVNSGERGIEAFDLMAAGMAAVFMMVMVLATVVALLFVLLYRMVMLWVLIVVAPLAWFGGSLKNSGTSVVSQGPTVYNKWWGKFTCAVAIGPIVTFFLWLSLSVAGSGNIAAMEGFATTGTEENVNAGQSFLAIMDSGNLLAFFIGIMLLWAGLEAAMDVCSSEAFIKSALGKAQKSGKTTFKKTGQFARGVGRTGWKGVKGTAGLGWRGAKGTVKLGAKAGWATTKAGWKYGGKGAAGWVAKQGLGKLERDVVGRQDVSSKMRDMARSDKLDNFFGRGVSTALRGAAGKLDASSVAQLDKAKEKHSGTTVEDQVHRLGQLHRAGALTEDQKRERDLLMQRMLTDEGMQKRMRQQGMLEGVVSQRLGAFETRYKGNADMENAVAKFKERNAGLTGQFKINNFNDADSLDDASYELLAYGGTDATKNSRKAELEKRLGSIKTKYKGKDAKDGEYYNYMEALERGLLGTDKQALAAGDVTARGMALKNATTAELREIGDSELASAVSADVVEGNAALADRLLQNRNLQQEFTPGANEDETVAKRKLLTRAALMKRAGVEGGDIVDADAFTGAVSKNTSLFGMMDQGQLGQLADNSSAANATAARSLSMPGVIDALMKAKKNPEQSDQLVQNLHAVLSAAASNGTMEQSERNSAQQMLNAVNNYLDTSSGEHFAREAEALEEEARRLEDNLTARESRGETIPDSVRDTTAASATRLRARAGAKRGAVTRASSGAASRSTATEMNQVLRQLAEAENELKAQNAEIERLEKNINLKRSKREDTADLETEQAAVQAAVARINTAIADQRTEVGRLRSSI